MAVLDDIKMVLGIGDTTQDNLLSIYIRRAVVLITTYLNAKPTTPPLDITVAYPDAVIEYVILCMNKKGSEGLKQFNIEGTSGTFNDDGLPENVKILLPSPYARLI